MTCLLRFANVSASMVGTVREIISQGESVRFELPPCIRALPNRSPSHGDGRRAVVRAREVNAPLKQAHGPFRSLPDSISVATIRCCVYHFGFACCAGARGKCVSSRRCVRGSWLSMGLLRPGFLQQTHRANSARSGRRIGNFVLWAALVVVLE